MLKAVNLSKNYGKRTVIKSFSMEAKRGEIVGLLGPNGAGKTTSFYMIIGIVKSDGGEVFLNDNEISKYPIHKRAQMGLAYLPQEASIFRDLSVEDNIMVALEMKFNDKEERVKRLEKILDEFNLGHIRNSHGKVLSGGERRRVEVARMLATEPKYVLLDEPFAGVDPISIKDIMELMEDLKRKNIGVIITDHNVRETLKIVDKAYILYNGEILVDGTAEEILENQTVRDVYLGHDFKI